MIHIDPSELLSSTATTTFSDIQYPNNPFHVGEIHLQKLEHMHDHVMSYAPQFIRSHYMPEQHRQFYQDLPFLVVAIRDPQTGYLWSSLLERTDNSEENVAVASSPDPNSLLIHTRPVVGDALEHVFDGGSTTSSSSSSSPTTTTIDVGILGIQFETARRNRVNGRITIQHHDHDDSDTAMNPQTRQEQQLPLVFKVDQSFGNCPQYIKPRKQWYRAAIPTVTAPPNTAVASSPPVDPSSRHVLSSRHIQWIETAETFFTATGFRNLHDPDHTTNVRYGNDASHRGGPPGFVKVTTNEQQEQQIVWTEFSGNNHFNSLGNLIVDSRIGLSFPDFSSGGMLQITGTATVQMGNLQQGQRQVHMSITAINEVPPGSLPIRWPSDLATTTTKQNGNTATTDSDDGWSLLQVTKIVQESKNVKSFYLQRPSSIDESSYPTFRAGQHLPIQLDTGVEVLDRRYSISSAPFSDPSRSYYRISVKKHEHGKSSSYLHQHVKVGDHIKAGQPGGGFLLENGCSRQQKLIVFISAGIGITPLLSMLHELVACETQEQRRTIIWIHGARNGQEHPFRDEMKEIQQAFAVKHPTDVLKVHTLYSSPDKNDTYDKVGRITVPYIQEVVPNLTVDTNLKVYMCGPLPFLADMETGLVHVGVEHSKIFYETF